MKVYEFASLPHDHDVPYAQVTADIEVPAADETGSSAPPGRSCLSSTAFWPASDPDIKALAEDIGKGLVGPEKRVEAFLEWLAPEKNIAFGGPLTGSRWGVKKVLSQKFGCCWDFSDCFITLCRAVGIPARQVGGWFYGMEGHVWAEVFCGGVWKQVDPTGGGRLDCGIYHVSYFRSDTGAMPILYLDRPSISIVAAGKEQPVQQ
jgi:transglutaminase-like putative cysteine protease